MPTHSTAAMIRAFAAAHPSHEFHVRTVARQLHRPVAEVWSAFAAAREQGRARLETGVDGARCWRWIHTEVRP